jgi:hypothetical protein
MDFQSSGVYLGDVRARSNVDVVSKMKPQREAVWAIDAMIESQECSFHLNATYTSRRTSRLSINVRIWPSTIERGKQCNMQATPLQQGTPNIELYTVIRDNNGYRGHSPEQFVSGG